MSSDNLFGELLLERIKSAKTSRTAFGRTIGVHRTTVSDYILGKYLPTEETFHRIHQVFPDEELYNAYFNAVRSTEPRKNKHMIPNTESYNYYKAEIDKPVAEYINTVANSIRDDLDREYITMALKFTLDYLKETGARDIAPSDYKIYKQLYEKYSR